MRTLAAIIASALLLTACGGDNNNGGNEVDFSSWKEASLVTSYPRDGHTEVATSAPVALRFTHALTTEDPLAPLSFETAGGEPVAFTARLFADGRGLMLTPREPLAPNTAYVVDVGEQTSGYGAVQMPDGGVRFTTRAKREGATQDIVSDAAFRVNRLIPDGTSLPMMDFSSLRLQFTQPIDTTTLAYAEDGSVALRDSNGTLVDAHVLAEGPYLTVDPSETLEPDEEYTLALTSDLRSTLGNALQPGEFAERTFMPGNSQPRETLIQEAGVSNANPAERCGPDTTGDTLSPLTGMPVNCVPLQAMLLGDATSVQQEGILAAELAFPPNHPEVTPFRVPRGSVLNAASVEVFIAGAAPAGYDSGEVRVSFLSDAVGYLTPNPYTDDKTAPKRLRMFMDIAMTTAGDQANGAMSQDIMHVELVGNAIVQDGRLTIDAVGMVEPKILNQEYGQGLISFQLASFVDQKSAPRPAPDGTLPTLQSWLPGQDSDGESRAGEMRPGDPLIVNLSEPVEPDTVAANETVTLSGPGGTQVETVRVDGATLVIQPQPALQYGGEYTIGLTAGITDLAVNPLDQTYSLGFSMPHHVDGPDRAPLATTTYPGYPCATISQDIANGDQGRCAGGKNSDDDLPVTTLPANRAIQVQFSQEMDPASIQLGGSFIVQRNSAPDGSGSWSAVPGRLEVGQRMLRFHPDTPWSDGALYRYVLGSNGGGPVAAGDCDGSEAICSVAGYPLQTRMLAQSLDFAAEPTDGGPDMTIHFHGTPATDGVLQTFRNLPTVDVNANLVHDGRTVDDDESTCTPQTCEALPASDAEGDYIVEENAARLQATGVSGPLVEGGKVGCDFSTDCPEKQFLWLTASLHSEVVGTGIHERTGQEAVRVKVFPNIIYTSNIDTYVNLAGSPVHVPSEPQIMRIRYATDDQGNAVPLRGWIYTSDGSGEQPAGTPIFEVQADLYLDAPYLTPPIGTHQLRSQEVSMTLRGPVTFTRDGRMQVRLKNVSAVPIPVRIDPGSGEIITLNLEIPADGTFLVFTQPALKQ